MALLGSFTKQPSEVLDFDVSYVTVLAGRTDVIVTSSTEVTGTVMTGTPVVATEGTVNASGNSIKIVVSAGMTGNIYKVTITATSNASPALIYEDEVNVIVEES